MTLHLAIRTTEKDGVGYSAFFCAMVLGTACVGVVHTRASLCYMVRGVFLAFGALLGFCEEFADCAAVAVDLYALLDEFVGAVRVM